MNNKFINFEPEMQQLMQRFEEAQQNQAVVYFDVDDFECIIDNYMLIGELTSARNALTYALCVHPDSNLLRCKEGKLFLLEGHYRKAINLLTQYDNLQADYVGILAESNLHMHYFQRAKELFDKYLTLCNPDELEIVFEDISTLFNSYRRYDFSIYYLDNGVALFPESTSLLVERAFTLERLGRNEEAISIYDKLLSTNPYSAEIWTMMASAQFTSNKFTEAIRSYDYALAIKPDDIDLKCYRAHCLFNLEKYEETIEPYTEYLRNNPKNEFVNTFLAEAYESLDQTEKAIIYYKRALKISKYLPEAWMGLATCYQDLGRLQSAYRTILKAKRLFPDKAKVYYTTGRIENNLSAETDDDKYLLRALHNFLECLKRDKKNDTAAFDAGTCYLQLGDYQYARIFFMYAYSLNPDIKNISLFLAITYYALEDYTEAEYYYKSAVEVISNAKQIFLSLFPNAEGFLQKFEK